MTCFAFPVLALAWILLFFGSFLYLLSRYHAWIMASINLVIVAQSNIFNRDFVIDHKVSVELRYSEVLDQANTYHVCFLNIALTFRKCPSRVCNDFSFNYANAFAWMHHTLNWLKRTCSRKAKTAPEHLLGMIFISHWNGQDLIAHPFWSWHICCASL